MTDPKKLERQHAHDQTQDGDALAETARLLISSAESFEEAASVASKPAHKETWRREAENRWALAQQVQSWLQEHHYLAPKEGFPLGSIYRRVLDASAALQAGDAAAQRTIALGEGLLRQRVSALRRQSDLSESAQDLMCFVEHQLQPETLVH
jgi:hypothetical protein